MTSQGTPKKSGAGYPGQMGLWGSTSDFNKTYFLIQQLLALVRTATLVQVVKCTTASQIGPVGFVDVIPLVNMIDGLGNATKHGTVYNLTYSRVQGGKNAIICDPCKGDIGVAVIADRDISAVKKTKKQSNPGSRRKNDLADGMYLFGCLNAAPTQYVRFVTDADGTPTGMEIVDVNGNKRVMTEDGITDTDVNGNTIVMDSDGIKINGVLFDRDQNVSEAAAIDATDEITAFSGGADSVGLSTHTHGGVAAGSADTDPPTGGT